MMPLSAIPKPMNGTDATAKSLINCPRVNGVMISVSTGVSVGPSKPNVVSLEICAIPLLMIQPACASFVDDFSRREENEGGRFENREPQVRTSTRQLILGADFWLWRLGQEVKDDER